MNQHQEHVWSSGIKIIFNVILSFLPLLNSHPSSAFSPIPVPDA